MKKTTTLVLCLGLALYSQAQDFEMLKDFDPSGSGNPGSFMEYDDKLYFSAYDGSERELWVSDGTAAGTQLFKDINPTGSGTPYSFTVCNGKLYFSAEDATHGRELWVSDGTPSGTQMVKDIHPSGDGLPSWLTAVGDKLYFAADDGVHGRELWVTDGTTAGTQLIDIAPNIAGRPPGNSFPENLTVLNGDLYFSILGRALYKLESSSGSLQTVKVLFSSSDLSNSNKMSNFYVYNDRLYFSGDDEVNGRELWVSDGTTAGTTMLKDIHPSGASFPGNFIEYAGNLYFAANDGTHGAELWVSDGTESGTQMLSDINPTGSAGAYYFVPLRPPLWPHGAGFLCSIRA